jgi:hypothetical protein
MADITSATYFPDGRFRSPTAVPGKAAIHDEHVYSAIVLAHGGSGQQKIFTNPQGQTIPALKGSSITVAQAHQLTYTEVTTNLNKAGELGSALGDAAIKSIGLSLEQCGIGSTGTLNTWGATQLEACDVSSKVFFQFKNSSNVEVQGPVWAFPAAGGIFGSISSTANAVTQGLVNNGALGVSRRFKVPILVARGDSLEGVVGVAGSASLVFRTTDGAGAASLLTCLMGVMTKRDVRG